MASGLVNDAKEFARQFGEDDVPGLGAELAYRFLFAIFPFGIFLAALSSFIAGAVGVENPTDRIMSGLGDNLPSNLAGPVQQQLQQVLGHNEPGLLSVGGLITLYAAAGGMNALMKAMTRAYDVPETRPFLLRFAFAILLTVLGGLGVIVSFVTVVGGALLTQDLANRVGMGGAVYSAIALARWPIVFLILTFAVAVLYRYAPNVRPPWRWTILGAAVFAILWLLVTFGFAFYVSNFGRYNATYGAIAGVIVLMLWFYLTSIVLVSGAELVAVVVRSHEPELLEARRSEVGTKVRQDVDGIEREAESALGRHPRREAEVSAAATATQPAVTADDETDEGAAAT